MSEVNSLAIMTKAATMLAEANTAQELNDFRKQALTAAEWAKRKHMGEDVIRDVQGYALDAEVKMGRILAGTERAPGTRGQFAGTDGSGGTSVVPPENNIQTLADHGITKNESSRAQMLAALPKKWYLAIRCGAMTRVQVAREIKEQKRQNRRDENQKKVSDSKAAIPIGVKFATIVIDPPWDWGDEGDVNQLGRAKPDYHTMSISEIVDLPVANLADDDCHLYLWITNRSLPKGFDLLSVWGFRYVTCITWCKPSFGMGNYFRGSTEHLLFGVKGSQPLKRKDVGTWFESPRGNNLHSSKPDWAYELIESCSPGPYLEMFARCDREGWSQWGEDA